MRRPFVSFHPSAPWNLGALQAWALGLPLLAVSENGVAAKTVDMEGTAFVLLVGGLAILFPLAVVLLVQGLFPSKTKGNPELIAPKDHRRLRATPQRAQGRFLGHETPPEDDDSEPQAPVCQIDRALDRVVQPGALEPRILRRDPHSAVLELVACLGCAAGPLPTSVKEGCGYERRRLETVFRSVYGAQANVQETACRRAGAGSCAFEVKF